MISPLNILENKLEDFGLDTFHSTPWVFNLIDGLLELGINVTLISFSGHITKDYIYTSDGLSIFLLKSPKKISQIITLFGSCARRIKKNVDIEKIDMVHSHGAERSTLIALKLRKPVIATIHAAVENFFSGLGRARLTDKEYIRSLLLEKYVLKKLDNVICVSPQLAEEVKTINGKLHIQVIDNPINRKYFLNNTITFENEILFIGSLTKRKNVLSILKCLPYIPNVTLKIIYQSKDDNYLKKCNDFIHENKLQKRVVFLGRLTQDEILIQLRQACCLILFSRYETFGMVLAEAMAAGKPVIGSDLDSLKYVIDDEVTGFIVPNYDITLLADKINLLIKNKDIARKMGEDAKRVAQQRWHPVNIAKQTISYYNAALGK